MKAFISGIAVNQVIDRDSRTPQEIADLVAQGVNVLSRRHLEAYLLDDEVLTKLCKQLGDVTLAPAVLTEKQRLLQDSVTNRNNPPDDLKSIAGQLQVKIRQLFLQPQLGQSKEAFLRDFLAPLVPGTNAYISLKHDIFGS